MNALQNFFLILLGPDGKATELTLLHIALRGFIIFIVGLAIVRIGDRRSLAEKTAFDAALLIILASVLARAINGSAAFFATLGGSAVIVALHRSLAYASCRSDAFRRLIKGKPNELVRNGEFIRTNMRRNHVTDEDVCEDLRLDGEEDLANVKIARLECSGDISFIKK